MATASNIDFLRETRDRHLDIIKFIAKDVDDYQQSNKHDVDLLKIYQSQLEDEWKRFRLVQEELYDLDEEENTQEREAFVHFIALAARLRNLIEGRQLSTPSTLTGSGFPARCSSSDSTDATAPHRERFECPRQIALRHSRAIVNFPKITEESPTALRHLVNTVEKNLRSLNNLGESIMLNAIIISLIISKLPANVVRQWELTLPNEEVPRYIHLLDFLRKLECSLRSISTFRATRKQTCPICKGSHRIWRCDIFKAKSVNRRLKDVKAASLCTNCLKEGHSMQDCFSRSCRTCRKRHNTLLHKDQHHSKSRSSSSPTRHRKSTTKHKSETPWRDSSPGTSPSHRRTRKQWRRQSTIPMTTEPINPLASNSLYSVYSIQISVLNDKQQSTHCRAVLYYELNNRKAGKITRNKVLIIEIVFFLDLRPLTPNSIDPNTLLILTPGHFLVGD